MGRGGDRMILQVIFDDKFGDYAIDQFRNYQDKTRIVLVASRNDTIQHVHKIQEKDIIIYASPEYKELIAHLSDYKAVIMHGLFSYIQYDIVYHLPKETKLAWVLWGAEIYARSDTYTTYLGPLTKFVYWQKCMIDRFRKRPSPYNDVSLDILRRVDYLLGSSMELFEEVKKYVGNPAMQHLQYSYFTLEQLLGDDMLNQTVKGNNVLLGNCASPENNHIEAMLRLKRIGLPKGTKLITPLSYSTLWVKNIIFKIGHVLFKDQFYPLIDFMPRQEYNRLVQSCSAFIANHHRPNAFGNTLIALWLGARVYVSNKNVQTKFLQRLGLHVNIIETDLNRNNPNLYTPISEKEREENRNIIRKMYGKEQMQKNVETIISTLDE